MLLKKIKWLYKTGGRTPFQKKWWNAFSKKRGRLPFQKKWLNAFVKKETDCLFQKKQSNALNRILPVFFQFGNGVIQILCRTQQRNSVNFRHLGRHRIDFVFGQSVKNNGAGL